MAKHIEVVRVVHFGDVGYEVVRFVHVSWLDAILIALPITVLTVGLFGIIEMLIRKFHILEDILLYTSFGFLLWYVWVKNKSWGGDFMAGLTDFILLTAFLYFLPVWYKFKSRNKSKLNNQNSSDNLDSCK